jgi:hypothetical protein
MNDIHSVYQFCFFKNQFASVQSSLTSISISYIYFHLRCLLNVHNKTELKRVLVVRIVKWFTVYGINACFIQVDLKQKIRFCNKIRNISIVPTILIVSFFTILLPHYAQATSTALNYVVSFLDINFP